MTALLEQTQRIDDILRPDRFDWPPKLKVLDVRHREREFYDSPVLDVVVVLGPDVREADAIWARVKAVTRRIKQSLREDGFDGVIDVHYFTEAQLAEYDRPVDPEEEDGAGDAAA